MDKNDRASRVAFRPSESPEDWDNQGWSDRSERLTAAPKLETTVSVRFGPDDALLLRRAARLCGQTKSEFVRRATVHAAQKKIAESPVPVSFKTVAADEGCHITGSGRSSSLTGLTTSRRCRAQVKLEIG